MKLVPRVDGAGFQEETDRLVGDLRRAQARALNATAARVLEGLRFSMEEHLDKPTQQTLDGLYATKARPVRNSSVEVGVKPEVAEYLHYSVFGGTLTDVVIPTKDTPLDRHGNFRPGYLDLVEAGGGFWRVARSGVPTLFEPDGAGGIRAVAFRVERVDYEPRWPFEDETEALVARILPEEVENAFAAVLGE